MRNSLGEFFPRVLLLFFALIVTLVLMEGLLRAFVPVRNVGPAFVTYDPVYGKRLKPDFVAKRITPEFEMHFTTNSLGHRGPELGDTVHRPILFVGDSFTMGYGVSDGSEFPALVASHLQQSDREIARQIINLGVGNTGNGRHFKLLRDKAEALDPGLIVLQLTGNDFDNNLSEPLFVLDHDTNELIELDIPAPDVLDKLQGWIESIPGLADTYLIGFMRQVVEAFLQTKSPPRADPGSSDRRQDLLTIRLLKETLSLSHRNRWPIVVLSVDIENERLATLQEVCERYDVDLLPIASKRQHPDLYYVVDDHWNIGGHAHVADLMIDWLERKRQVWSISQTSD